MIFIKYWISLQLKDTNLERVLDLLLKIDSFGPYKVTKSSSFNLGIAKDFYLYDTEELINIDEISTLRKRLKHSMRNTVPFYIYSNKKVLLDDIKKDLKQILFNIFDD